jgi:hypothetical protein
VELIDGLGMPPISNVFSAAGRTLRPTLENGAVTVNNENVYAIADLRARPGTTVQATVSAKHPGTVQAYSIAFLFDKNILTFVDATCVGTAAALSVKPQTIESFNVKTENFSATRTRVSVGAVADFVPPFTAHEIPASLDTFQSLSVFTFDIKDDAGLVGTSTELTFHNGGPTDGNNVLVVKQQSVPTAMQNGRIDFIDAPLFRRGLINDDTRLDISDGIVMLGYMFLGDAEPKCMLAADVNADNRVDLSDAIYMFNYMFNGGPKPRDPFESCGTDQRTDGRLNCNFSVSCQ